MNYQKKDWQDLPDITTPVTATDLDRMEEGIADANGAIGVDAYDSTSTYAVGDLCIYNNTLYECNTAISTAENFTPAHWTQTSLSNIIFGDVLYDSTTPIISTTTLSGINFSNYKKLDVVIGRSDGAVFSATVKIDLEKTRNIGSTHINCFNFVDNDGTITFLYHLRAIFSGATITISGNNSVLRISDSGGISSITTPLLGIFKIVGYK